MKISKILAFTSVTTGGLVTAFPMMVHADTYTVKSGDTLSKIAIENNTNVKELQKLNNINNCNYLQVGSKITIPNSKNNNTYKTITVKAGDTLWKLSQEYNTTIASIQRINNLKTTTIYIGQTLKINVNSLETRNLNLNNNVSSCSNNYISSQSHNVNKEYNVSNVSPVMSAVSPVSKSNLSVSQIRNDSSITPLVSSISKNSKKKSSTSQIRNVNKLKNVVYSDSILKNNITTFQKKNNSYASSKVKNTNSISPVVSSASKKNLLTSQATKQNKFQPNNEVKSQSISKKLVSKSIQNKKVNSLSSESLSKSINHSQSNRVTSSAHIVTKKTLNNVKNISKPVSSVKIVKVSSVTDNINKANKYNISNKQIKKRIVNTDLISKPSLNNYNRTYKSVPMSFNNYEQKQYNSSNNQVFSSAAEQAAANKIAQAESSGSYTARNGKYYGRYQLDISYLHGNLSPANQNRVFKQYCDQRYGSIQKALAFREVHGWY